MRVLTVLVALIATPVLAGMAQDLGQSATRVSETGVCAEADEHRSPTSWEDKGQPADPNGRDWGGKRVGCSPVPPAPTCGVAPSATGTSGITGKVRHSVTGDALPDWCIEISGAATGSALTNDLGIYAFSGVAAGSYLVCLVVPDGWVQTVPSNGGTLCPSGYPGRSFSIAEGKTASFLDFKAKLK